MGRALSPRPGVSWLGGWHAVDAERFPKWRRRLAWLGAHNEVVALHVTESNGRWQGTFGFDVERDCTPWVDSEKEAKAIIETHFEARCGDWRAA